jgi:hypothetical protein
MYINDGSRYYIVITKSIATDRPSPWRRMTEERLAGRAGAEEKEETRAADRRAG